MPIEVRRRSSNVFTRFSVRQCVNAFECIWAAGAWSRSTCMWMCLCICIKAWCMREFTVLDNVSPSSILMHFVYLCPQQYLWYLIWKKCSRSLTMNENHKHVPCTMKKHCVIHAIKIIRVGRYRWQFAYCMWTVLIGASIYDSPSVIAHTHLSSTFKLQTLIVSNIGELESPLSSIWCFPSDICERDKSRTVQ